MKRLNPFVYREPATLVEAAAILAGEGVRAVPVAGGTDILVRMKRGEINPSLLVNLKRIAGLDRIERVPEGGVTVGAMASIAQVERSQLIRNEYPVLSQAAGLLGSPSIRNLATLGGNVGRASPAADTLPALIVLQALVLAEGPDGRRKLPIEQFFKGPGQTVLSHDEIITAIYLPAPTAASAAAYLKLGRREGMDCALVGAAAKFSLGANGGIGDVRVALAACAPVPLRARKAEEILLSGSVNEQRLREAARTASRESSPIADLRAGAEYRREMVEVLTYRVLHNVWQQLQGKG